MEDGCADFSHGDGTEGSSRKAGSITCVPWCLSTFDFLFFLFDYPDGLRASVHQLQADEGDGDVEGDLLSDEELQEFKAQTKRFPNNGPRNPARPTPKSDGTKLESEWGPHLTSRVRRLLRGKCFLCYKRGHMAPDCPDIEKYRDVSKRRQPTKAELKD
jgi:hypothetical protein